MAAQIKSGEWNDFWASTKRFFEANTGRKKPSPKVLGIFKQDAGLGTAAKACDKAFKALEETMNAKTLRSFTAAVPKFKTASEDYLKVLARAIEREPGIDTDYAKQLLVLKAALKGVVTSMENQVARKTQEVQQVDAFTAMARSFQEGTVGAVKRAKLLIAQMKAGKGLAHWNAEIKDAARDINQQIGNVNKLKERGHELPCDEPTSLFVLLRPWASEARKLPLDTTPAQLKREVDAFEQAIKFVSDWLKTWKV